MIKLQKCICEHWDYMKWNLGYIIQSIWLNILLIFYHNYYYYNTDDNVVSYNAIYSTATIHMNLGNTYYAWMNMDNAMKHFNLGYYIKYIIFILLFSFYANFIIYTARAVRERIFGTIHPLTC